VQQASAFSDPLCPGVHWHCKATELEPLCLCQTRKIRRKLLNSFPRAVRSQTCRHLQMRMKSYIAVSQFNQISNKLSSSQNKLRQLVGPFISCRDQAISWKPRCCRKVTRRHLLECKSEEKEKGRRHYNHSCMSSS
jgi:hypothetical protein